MVHQPELHLGGFRFIRRRYIGGMEPEIRALAEMVSERLVARGAQAMFRAEAGGRGLLNDRQRDVIAHALATSR
jgi:hypothetical protein